MESNNIQDMGNGTNVTAVELGAAVEADNSIAVLERYTVPIICVFGLIGNSVSAIVFSRPSIRRDNSSSFFLVARSLSDNGFLAALLVIWSSSFFNLSISIVPGVCQVLIFFTYFFGCLSVWLVVFLTAENYIRICKPFLVRKVCKTVYAKTAVTVLLILVVTVYNFPLWTTMEQCVPYKKYYSFIQVMTYIDSVLTLVAPSTVMAVLMVAVAVTAIKAHRRHRRSSSMSTSSATRPLTKVTTMLLAVTLIFFFLNLPYHAVRFRLMIMIFMEKKDLATDLTFVQTLQSVSQMLYYLSLATNVVIYAVFSSKFRTVVKNFFLRTKKSNTHKGISVEKDMCVRIHPMRMENLLLKELPGDELNNGTKIEETSPLRRLEISDT